jgi:Flp pilus assembly pilin Flp
MLKLCTRAKNFFLAKKEEGASLVEYALLLTLIAAALVAVIEPLRTAIINIFTAVTTALTP